MNFPNAFATTQSRLAFGAVHRAASQFPDSEFWILAPEFSILDSGISIRESKFQIPKFPLLLS